MKWLQFLEWLLPFRALKIVQSDETPSRLPIRALTLIREGAEDWCIALRCPCGCDQRIELPLIQEASPNWQLRIEPDGAPTLIPSVWLRDGCRSHFFIRRGKVDWVVEQKRVR